MFKRVTEAGKSISGENMAKVQTIHDTSSDMGADCSTPMWGGIYESARIWEAALPMTTSHDALRGHLRNALNTAHGKPQDSYGYPDGPYVTDVFPNHVVYQHKGQMMKRSYTSTPGAAGSDPTITLGEPKNVHTAYVDSAKDGDKVGESVAILTDMPTGYVVDKERLISKATRDTMDSKDFAGKHKSYPIEKPEDVDAALKSIGRAGADNHDAATLKANILRIAKRKGFAIPASDKGESVVTTLAEDEVLVTESAEFCLDSQELTEALIKGAKESAATGKPTTIPIKIIGPGWGSMAHYSKEMIKESGPVVFTKLTHMYWNHPTSTQEAERPEGDINDLAAVLTENAAWNDNGPKGPGLYSKAKVFSDYSNKVMEKGAHIGISINSPIKYHEGEAEGRHGRIAEKFIKSPLTSADFVTRAGAKGAPIVPVQEAERRSQNNKENQTMTPEQEKALLDKVTALEADNATLREGQNKALAVATVSTVLREAGVDYNERLLSRTCEYPTMKEGKVDTDWAKAVIADFSGNTTAAVTGLGHATVSEAVIAATTEKEAKALRESFIDLGMSPAAADLAVKGRG